MGNVRIQLESWEEVQALYVHVHGKVITVNGESRFLEIHNAFLSDVAQINGMGVGSRGQRLPQDSRASR